MNMRKTQKHVGYQPNKSEMERMQEMGRLSGSLRGQQAKEQWRRKHAGKRIQQQITNGGVIVALQLLQSSKLYLPLNPRTIK